MTKSMWKGLCCCFAGCFAVGGCSNQSAGRPLCQWSTVAVSSLCTGGNIFSKAVVVQKCRS
jgi:hypothetical protein